MPAPVPGFVWVLDVQTQVPMLGSKLFFTHGAISLASNVCVSLNL